MTEKLPPVLDVCCGSRMFWFDRKDHRAVFVDKRKEEHMLTDCYGVDGKRYMKVDPDIQADFTDLPFPDESFFTVIFDPPHLLKLGTESWLAKKYGKLEEGWRGEIKRGFSECFRVLKIGGTLIFKWNETDIPLSQVLALTEKKPLVGHRSGKAAKTHWVTFIKLPLTMEDF